LAYFFVSYSHRDGSAVRALCDILRDHGVDFWLDEERLDQAGDLNLQIRRALAEAAGVLVCVSEFMQRTYGYVFFEHMLATSADARAGGSKIVVARLNQAKLSPDFVLADAVVDYFETGGPETLVRALKHFETADAAQSRTQTPGLRTGEDYFAALLGLTGDGPMTIGDEKVNLDLIGRRTAPWYRRYEQTPSAKQLLDDIAAERPFFSVNDDITRAAYLSGKAVEAVERLANSPATGGVLWEMLGLLLGDGETEAFRELSLQKLGPRMLEALRTWRVSDTTVRALDGSVAHWLIFVLIPGSCDALEPAVVRDSRDRLGQMLDSRERLLAKNGWALGNTALVSLFLNFLDNGDVAVSAKLVYVPSLDPATCAEQPDDLNKQIGALDHFPY
jgi:hypothetical protein